jgi:hypothetical protein
MVARMTDDTPRIFKVGDALSQLGNVAWPFWDHRTTTANESISGRCHREQRWFRHVIDALFFMQRNPRHCERAHRADVTRAKRFLADEEQRNEIAR